MQSNFTSASSRTARAAEISAAALFLVYIVIIALHRWPPSLGDYGDLTYQGMLLHRHMVGLPDPFHVVKRYPVPDGLVSLAVAVLMLGLSWAAAAKVWLCCQLALSWAVTRYFLQAAGNGGAIAWIAPTAIFLNLNFWYGFLNFELSLCWAILLAAVLFRGARGEWQCGVLVTLGFFSHMVPFCFGALMLIAYAVQHRRVRLLWQLVPAVLLGLWYLLGRFYLAHNADGAAGMVSPVRQFSGAFWMFKLNSFLKSFGFVNLGTKAGSYSLHLFGEPVYLLLFVLNLAVAIVLGYCLIQTGAVALRRRTPDWFVWVAAVCFLPVYLLAPGAALGIADPGSRVLQALLGVCLLLCASRSVTRAAAAGITALAAASLFLFFRAAYVVPSAQTQAKGMPGVVLHFAHVPNHDKDEYLQALGNGDGSLAVFPTGLLLNTPAAVTPESREQ